MTDPVVPALPAPQESDFLALLQNLLPRGRAWPRDPDAIVTATLSGLALAQANVRARQVALPIDAFPANTEELVPEWEQTLGLPDPCLGPNPAMAARKAAIDARIAATGGQSVAYYQQLAVNLGGSIAVTEYAPWRWGVNAWLQPLYTAGWAFHWLVTLDQGAVFRLEWDVSSWGEPFWQVANNPIACEIQRLKPAHTIATFTLAEGVAPDLFLLDDSGLDTLAGLA